MDAANVIYIVIGMDTAEKRFFEFFNKSMFLFKNKMLRKASKQNLTLKTEHFLIRFVPNSNIDLLHGLRCSWAYGFDPTKTKYLEFRTDNNLKELKPLVENLDELFERIVQIEEKYKGD